MLSGTLCYALEGVDGRPVCVETDVQNGLGSYVIVGLPDAAVKESRNRVTIAMRNSGYHPPVGNVTVNLSPADLRKEGAVFDLSIAVSLLCATRQLRAGAADGVLLLGELSLDGRLLPVRGVLSMVVAARENGVEKVVLPALNAPEVATLQGMQVFPAQTLRQAAEHLEGTAPILAQAQKGYAELLTQQTYEDDLSRVRGQAGARRALEIAAAGGHNMLMIGVPGSGKTMLARCLPGILPQMTLQEAMEVTRIHSVAGALPSGSGLMVTRPFRSPHHSASMAALVGGGANAMPGEISLAHNGVLFLDELPEYPRSALEALRQPLEDGKVTISRVRARMQYMSRCMLVASMNPCPCGYYGSRARQCKCGAHEIRKYLDKVSGPLLDRIDLQVEVDAVPVSDISGAPMSESSRDVRLRVQRAREIQQARFDGSDTACNARMSGEQLNEYCILDDPAKRLLSQAMEKFALSMRAYTRLLKVSRTIADLRGDEVITLSAVAEAVQYRTLDKKYWS